MTSHKVIWVADFTLASSPREAACYAMECGLSGFGTATVFQVDGLQVDVEGDDPSENQKCYDDMALCTRDVLAEALRRWDEDAKANAWAERDDPERWADSADFLIEKIKEVHAG